jgi:hypothetical protein
MKTLCPYCRKEIDFMEMQQDKDIIAIITMSGGFGKNAHLVWAYVELFGVTPMRGKTKKIRVILEEMKGLFESGAYKYEKRKYQISQAGIAEALNVVVHRHFPTHLDNHNYLKKVMIGISDTEGRESGKQAEKDLRKREDKGHVRRADEPFLEEGLDSRLRGNDKKEEEENLSPEQVQDNLKRLKEIVGGGIGKRMED